MKESTGDSPPPTFEEIVARYEEPIFLRILKRVGDREVAEDLTQETFLSAYRSFASLPDYEDLDLWLFSIADKWCGTLKLE